MAEPSSIPTQTSYVCVGNPGSGKSTVLNGLMKESKFKSGIAIGTGKTTVLQIEVNKLGQKFIDTPGLADIDIKAKAAKEIDTAFKTDGPFTLYFVITLEAGRLRPDDLATIRLVLEATHVKSDEFSVIINKVTAPVMKLIEADENAKNALFIGINSTLPVKTNYIHYYPKNGNLEDIDDQLLPLTDKFIQFIKISPIVPINNPDDIDINSWKAKSEDTAKKVQAVETKTKAASVDEIKLMKRQIQEGIFNEVRDFLDQCPRCKSTAKFQLLYTIYSSNRFICNCCNVNKTAVEDGVLHCKSCDFDICNTCAQSVAATKKQRSEREAMFTKVRDSTPACIRCKSTEKYQILYKVYSSNNYVCNCCRRTKSSVQEGVLHCKSCDFDICPACAPAFSTLLKKAEANESMLKKVQGQLTQCMGCKNPEPYQLLYKVYSYNSYICNCCRATKNSTPDGVLHCKKCDFDICPSCADKMKK